MQRAQIGYCLADSKSAFWLLAALKRDFNITEIEGVSTRIITEALASAVEQSAYVWYARESLNAVPVPVETAAEVLARIWYHAIWGTNESSHMDNKQRGRSRPTKRSEMVS